MHGISIKFIEKNLPFFSFHILHVLVIVRANRVAAKVGSPKELSYFHPISILCVFAKPFERLLNDQILGHIEDNGLLSEFQSGFRRGNSTDDLGAARADGKDAVLVLVDFSKAFDYRPHDLLVHKLRVSSGFSPSAARLIASFLTGRSNVSGG
jgi:Reverse transcriptase (RNA-dependent DNA polymerase)